ncbi:threonine/homoserine/homoserine lactone efflux protein [Roseibium hamelinense]|uniref:Threonine/homoserine/homoserine lactone efflux protein n=1 Tax=Roseibium hamelinense TaxID=150831 RepID=A0A562T287_9HYPH|nr:LysE family translocator [Roseibium hamelinense]MTI44597.1 LysE family translocator [Roseibium hamelinense]TWI87224.1 threonine/homoserine/homoserine lactone efflux protein [Roseibium hamelinense]
MTLEFLIAAFIVVFVPGTGVVYTVAVGLGKGRRASLAAAFGCTLGIVPAIVASLIGVSALLHTSALAFQIVKYAGVAYLLYLAWQTLRDSGPMDLKADRAGGKSLLGIATSGTLINVLNPKLTMFFLAFLPQFVDPAAGNATAQMLAMSGVFMAMTFAVFIVYGQFAALVGERVLRSDRVLTWMRRSIAATFAAFGARLAFAER